MCEFVIVKNTASKWRGAMLLAVVVAISAVQARVCGADDVSGLKTFSSAGKGQPVLNGYKEAELLRHEGKGCLTQMWFGGNWPGYEKTRIRVYADGEEMASIDMELGLGHGYGFGDDAAPWGSEKMGKTGHPSGVYNTYQIPFGKSVRVTAQRAKQSPDGAVFWWIIHGTENRPVTLGGVRLPDQTRLKLYKRENHDAKVLEEFNLCDVKGPGALYQVTMAAKPIKGKGGFGYLEACMRGYFDGAQEPVLLSSGLEDYFAGTYYFNRGRYANALAGLTHKDNNDSSFSAYRFHDADSLFFQKGFRLTCRCGETEHGAMEGSAQRNSVATRFTTYTWVYQW